MAWLPRLSHISTWTGLGLPWCRAELDRRLICELWVTCVCESLPALPRGGKEQCRRQREGYRKALVLLINYNRKHDSQVLLKSIKFS